MRASKDATKDLAQPRQAVGALVQGISVLRHLARLDSGQGVTAIARALSISPSSCFNILRTLVAEGLVEFDVRDKSYTLGFGIAELVHDAFQKSWVFTLLREQLQDLAERFHVTVSLVQVQNKKKLVVIGVAESGAEMQIQIKVGIRAPLLAGASGKCVAAFGGLTDAEIRKALAQVRFNIPTSPEEFLRDIEQVREDGWAIDAEQNSAGITVVGAPIFNSQGQVPYCVVCTSFKGQHSAEELDSLCRSTRDLGLEASRQLGWSEPSSAPQS